MDDGSQIRLQGEGELGSYGGPRGNCYVVLNVADHAFFERQDDDIHLGLNINFVQAAMGDEVEIPMLDGGSQKQKIGAGVESGEVITLRGKGVPHLRGGGRGDLHVHVQVTTPKHLNAEQKKLLKRLGETMEESDKEGGKNIFDKVKDALGGS